jgi:hypothetical protein
VCPKKGGEKLETEIKSKFVTLKVTIFSLVILSLLATASVSFATSPTIYAHGGWTWSNTVVSYNNGPTVTTYVLNFEKVLTGTLKGTIVGVCVENVYPDGAGAFQYTGVFTGTAGSSSSGTALVQASGTFSLTTLTATISFSEGTGGLTGLHGSVKSHSSASPNFDVGTYAGWLHLG